MSALLLISVRPGETLGALVEDGRMTWFDFVRTLHEGMEPLPVGAVCLGRVRRVEPGLQAAFVDIGPGEAAMLTAKDARVLAGKDGGALPIQRLVHEGAALPVRVSRAGRDGKGPRVTADLALPQPLRTEIEARAKAAAAPALLWRPPEPDPAVRLLGLSPVAPDAIEVDHEPAAAALRRALAEAGSNAEVAVSRDDVFSAHGLAGDVDGLSAPIVPLEGGGSLIIEPAAALTSVDVNAGGALGSTAQDTALRVNREAAPEIARQIALRQLGGIVVIDFLRLKAARHRREIVGVLRKELEMHRISAQISDVSPSGLVELVVPRTGLPLRERLRSPCPRCGGSGAATDPAAQALALLARVVREARTGRVPGLEVRAAPEIAGWLDAHADAVRRELERFAVTAVSWRAEPGLPPEHGDVRRRN